MLTLIVFVSRILRFKFSLTSNGKINHIKKSHFSIQQHINTEDEMANKKYSPNESIGHYDEDFFCREGTQHIHSAKQSSLQSYCPMLSFGLIWMLFISAARAKRTINASFNSTHIISSVAIQKVTLLIEKKINLLFFQEYPE